MNLSINVKTHIITERELEEIRRELFLQAKIGFIMWFSKLEEIRRAFFRNILFIGLSCWNYENN